MEPLRQKITARLALLLLGACGLLWLARIDYPRKISTNVIDLLPVDERSPELVLLRSLADERQARVVLLALTPASPEAARRFADTLRASPLFAEAVPVGDPAARDALGAFILERRLDFLLPAWLAAQDRAFAATGLAASRRPAWLAERTAQALDDFLARPEAGAFQGLVPRDPLLLVPPLLQAAGLLSPPASASEKHSLVWARLAVSPLEEDGQQPVFDAIDRALATVRVSHPGVALQWAGVNRFAHASKERIRSELSWLNTLSLAAVLAIALLFVRRPWKALHLVPVIAFSLLAGWVAVTLVFDRVHILVFVIGALLTGVAIDYGFYLYLQPALSPGEHYREKLRRLLKPLLTSCLTTIVGFSFLLFSELPLIRQLGVFVSAGLLGALAAAMLYFAQLDHPYLEARAFALPSGRAAPRRRLGVRLLALAALSVALAGPWLLRWHDDIRELNAPDPGIAANDDRVRALFGETEGRSIYVTRGDSPAEARARLAAFEDWHARAFPDSPAAGLGLVLPTEADFLAAPARLASLAGFETDFHAALARHGYETGLLAPFFEDWRARLARPPGDYAALAADLQGRLTGSLGLLFFSSGAQTWFVTLAAHPPGAEPPAELATAGTNQLVTLNSLFSRYRASALRLSALGLAVIGASVFVLYGPRRGVRIFTIPCGACFFTFGLLGLTGHTLNLFHLLGAFLGVCLSHNYAIFSAENAARNEAPPVSIRLSALTTAASFGVLALSRIPVVAALGSTVALTVLTALLMVELEPLGRKT